MIKKVILFFGILFFMDMLMVYIVPEKTLSSQVIRVLHFNEWYRAIHSAQNSLVLSNAEANISNLTAITQKVDVSQSLHSTIGSQKKCGYITWGYTAAMGLGNRMFVYASLFGAAKRNNKIAYIPDFDYALDKMFKVSILPTRSNESFNWAGQGENGCCRYDKGSENLPCSRNVNFWGFRQSWKYFERDDIKKEFTFLPRVENPCMEVLTNVSIQFNCSETKGSNRCIYIGAHMRRGDFTDPGKQHFGHSPATTEYLRKAVNYFDTHLSYNTPVRLVYVILGNDYQWNLNSSQNVTSNPLIVLKPDTKEMDLCILTKCNHTIISAGSYGWWAAYLAGGNVTYMKNQCRPGSSLCGEFTMEDYINPEWPWVAL